MRVTIETYVPFKCAAPANSVRRTRPASPRRRPQSSSTETILLMFLGEWTLSRRRTRVAASPVLSAIQPQTTMVGDDTPEVTPMPTSALHTSKQPSSCFDTCNVLAGHFKMRQLHLLRCAQLADKCCFPCFRVLVFRVLESVVEF